MSIEEGNFYRYTGVVYPEITGRVVKVKMIDGGKVICSREGINYVLMPESLIEL